MPAELDRMVKALMRKGYSETSAWKIANSKRKKKRKKKK